MKTIVTHVSPDLDAIAGSWLIKRYLPGWSDAEHAFVSAGGTLNDIRPDENSEIMHVDTGLGNFDHHQFNEHLSATKQVFRFLVKNNHIKERDLKALEEMVTFITDIDNFGEVHFPDPTDIKYAFCLHEFISPLRGNLSSDHELMSVVMLILDSILYTVKNSLRAHDEMREGVVINTSLGKTLVMETPNEVAIKYALKKGYEVVVRRDPETNAIRIKTQPDAKYDLTKLYKKMLKVDSKATWFLHASKHMLLNGSTKNPQSTPSGLTLVRLIEILKKI